jgi:hypothetical protein
MLHGIAFRNKETGQISYYTGKAGGDWLSPNANDCFFGYALVGANYKGNRMLSIFPALANHEYLPVTHPIGTDDTEGGSCD